MTSMTLATLGWAVVWTALCLRRWAPELAPDPVLTLRLASGIALVGLAVALFTLRAKLAWILITAAPLFANTSLLCLRWVVPDLLAPTPELEDQGAEAPEVELD